MSSSLRVDEGGAAPAVLAISSQVVYGTVGNSAAVPALQSLGVSVLALPTVILSGHPGLGKPAVQSLPAEMLEAMLDALLAQGRLDHLAAVMTGYFTDVAQVEAVAGVIARLKSARPLIHLCDPILGDDPDGLYVPQPVAEAMKMSIVPLADVITPNRFELSWMADLEVNDPVSAAQAGRKIAPLTVATSIPLPDGRLGTMLIGSDCAFLGETRRRPAVPHGTGDLLSGLLLGHLVRGSGVPEALAAALGGLETVLDLSEGQDSLDIARGLGQAAAAKPWPMIEAIEA